MFSMKKAPIRPQIAKNRKKIYFPLKKTIFLFFLEISGIFYDIDLKNLDKTIGSTRGKSISVDVELSVVLELFIDSLFPKNRKTSIFPFFPHLQ